MEPSLRFGSFSRIRGNSSSMLNAIQSNCLPPLVALPPELAPPPLHLALHHVFGFEATDRRNTAVYVGRLQAFERLCYVRRGYSRQIVTVVDRLAVLHKATRLLGLKSRPEDPAQQYYQGHVAKIGCIAVHPDKELVATGECSHSSAIHVWNSKTLQVCKKIDTYHGGPVVNMAFSYDGKYLASLGIQHVFGLQVCEWKTERVVAFARMSERPMLDLRFDTIDPSVLAVCGVNCIEFFRLAGSSLVSFLRLELNHLAKPVATCLDFLIFAIKQQVSTELLVGTSTGDLLVASHKQKQAVVAVAKAHSAAVTLIKVTCCLSTVIRFFTAGKDGLIKIWTSKMQLLRTIDVAQQIVAKVDAFKEDTPVSMNPTLDASKVSVVFPLRRAAKADSTDADKYEPGRADHSVQSLDFWHMVETQKNEPHGRLPFLLVSTKSGFLVEVVLESLPETLIERGLDCEVQGEQLACDPEPNSLAPSDYTHVALVARSQITTPNSQTDRLTKKQLSSVHPHKPYIAIVGSNEELVVRNFDSTEMLVKFQFDEANPTTAMTWHSTEDLLVIGFQSGMVHIYCFEESVGVDRTAQIAVRLDSFLPPTGVSPVLAVAFDYLGQYMAVSFGSSGQAKDDSFVKVYIDRLKAASDCQQSLKEGRFVHYFDIRCPSIQSSYDSALKSFSMAAFFMEFSVDSRFLLLSFQLVDDKLKRNNKNSQGVYLLWDLKLNNSVRSWEGQKEAVFQSLKFPNHSKGRYLLFNPKPAANCNPTDFQDLGPALYSQQVDFSAILQYTKQGSRPASRAPLFLGDEAGFLHLTTLASMYSPEGDAAAECLASLVKAHASAVDWMQCSGDGRWLFTRGVGDSALLMWRVSESSHANDLDYLSLPAGSSDVFGEVLPQPALEYRLENVVQRRMKAAEIGNNVSRETEGEVYLELEKVIGRSAHSTRNNICFTADNGLVLVAGTLLVVLTIPEKNVIPSKSTFDRYFKQSVIRPACHWRESPAPELGSIAVCHDHQVISVSTLEKNSRLLFWKVPSRSYLGTVVLAGYCSVLLQRFAEDSRTLGLIALTQAAVAALILVDVKTLMVTAAAEFSYSASFKIKDLSFLPGCHDRLVTSGIVHLKLWQVAGGVLHGNNLEIGSSIANLIEVVTATTVSEVGLSDPE